MYFYQMNKDISIIIIIIIIIIKVNKREMSYAII